MTTLIRYTNAELVDLFKSLILDGPLTPPGMNPEFYTVNDVQYELMRRLEQYDQSLIADRGGCVLPWSAPGSYLGDEEYGHLARQRLRV